MSLSRQSVGIYQETNSRSTHEGTLGQSSQLSEPLWTYPGLMNGLSLRELISTLKKKEKKAQVGNELSNILPKSSHARKKPPPPLTTENESVCKAPVV